MRELFPPPGIGRHNCAASTLLSPAADLPGADKFERGAHLPIRAAPRELGGQATGVTVSEIQVDDREPERRYLPGHPDADDKGYVAFPRMNPAEDMVDLMSASRGYQANVAAISAVKDMINRSIDLLR